MTTDAPSGGFLHIVVGYDGTVVQQVPFEREASSCTAADHICNCTYRFWPGFFR